MQRQTPFRKSLPEELFVLYQADETEEPRFHLIRPDGLPIEQESRFKRIELSLANRVSPWIKCDIVELISELADSEEIELAQCSRRFTELRLRETSRQWLYHQSLGIFASFH